MGKMPAHVAPKAAAGANTLDLAESCALFFRPVASNAGLAIFILLLTSVEALSLWNVPVAWIGKALIVFISLYLISKRLDPGPMGSRGLVALLAWLALITVVQTLMFEHEELHPLDATTPYMLFVFLRFVSLIAFIGAAYLTCCWIRKDGWEVIRKVIVLAGAVVALGAILLYLSERFGGTPALTNRLSTGGGESVGVFSYQFHRAVGPFREPSHLGEWLVLPFFLALSGKKWVVSGAIVGAALLLTGSLLAFIGALCGLLVSLIPGALLARDRGLLLWRFLVVVAISFVSFNLAAFTYTGSVPLLMETISDRMRAMWLDHGVFSSNRDYVWDFVRSSEVPLLGWGLGNANLILSDWMTSNFIVSFLSLYLNMLFSGGPIALVTLLLILLRPMVRIFRLSDPGLQLRARLAGYCGLLLMFSAGSEELSIISAVAYAGIAAGRENV